MAERGGAHETLRGFHAATSNSQADASVYTSRQGLESRVHQENADSEGSLMLIGAAIAGLVIVSLLLETFTSSPKPVEDRAVDTENVK
jgi:hypothetical protein